MKTKDSSIRRALGAFLLVLVATTTGCTGLRQVLGFKDQDAAARARVRILGTIEADGEVEGTLVVVVATPSQSEGVDAARPLAEGRELVGVDSYTRANPGTFLFVLDAGRYQLGAYEDRNRNGILDPGERVSQIRKSEPIELAPGGRAESRIRIVDAEVHQGDPIDVLGLVEKDVREQGRFALWAFSQKGSVAASLDEPRFGREQGSFGLWRPIDFTNAELAGVYFLDAFDDDRTPVLFVHGIAGFPREFEVLIEGLDRTRFQPWFYFYPSGVGLSDTSDHLARLLRKLQIEHDFDELAIVAHSMGGLVARGAILKYREDTGRDDLPLFVTIHSPFGGDRRAQRTDRARIAIPQSFRDMSPSSAYLRSLFFEDAEGRTRRRLPEDTDYHMIVGYGGSGEPYNDGTVSIESQARVELQDEAVSIRIWNASHTGILREPRTSDWINQLLEERF